MGWASGGQIFDLVTHALIESNATDKLLSDVCYRLGRALCEQDWDTVGESIDEFRDNPVVVEALRRAEGWSYIDEEEDAIIDYDTDTDEWSIAVAGRELGRAPGTSEGHDDMVRRWFADGEDTPQRRSQMRDFLLRPDAA